MENYSPSQDDKPEVRNPKKVMENIFPFTVFLPQASESNTDGITNAFDVASINRQKGAANFMFHKFDLNYIKAAFRIHNTDRRTNALR